jgi:hypothetical protein
MYSLGEGISTDWDFLVLFTLKKTEGSIFEVFTALRVSFGIKE